MKMKLAQRILLGYYKTKLKTIAVLSPRKAAEAAYQIFCTPYTGRPKQKAPPVFHKAEKLSFEMDGDIIRGFRWKAAHPNEKSILIVHGFGSYSYKFEKYISSLKKEGFTVLAFDAPGHGISEGKKINAATYRNALLRIEELFGPINAIMGHSLGGLAAALMFETLSGQENRKLVLVAPATETDSAISHFFSVLPVDTRVKQAFEQLICELSGKPISYFSVSRVVKNMDAPVLWVHDKNDTICSFEDVKPLLGLNLPHVRYIITEQLGHSGVYKDNNVCKEIVQFLSNANS
ncbi:MAG: alpha/beta fold hydrolase [Chitinophagaceae bacterium]|nr:alpha/beta fold hydrolase [Chitinophagaceae bacterium]MDP1762929.1 alpha/beta fold hydrolase [Sediminibacterium sp.]MDP1812661.1 alpha/beta fold hydrolase [Sediminibacterium sp.]MDP3127548.1 alpha/beta fold hydrolase [Sediminibacterium sp.]MDP3665757.1 alpha/beta fold hydrolase [Sediminibacterium sp.]